jgi:hypothetical protein
MVQLTTVPFKCRFEIASADGTASGAQGEFCAFEFPGCRGCKFALHAIKTIKATEVPMKSEALRAWASAQIVFRSNQGVSYGEVHSQGELDPVQETSR